MCISGFLIILPLTIYLFLFSSPILASSIPLSSHPLLSRLNPSQIATLHTLRSQLREQKCNLRICFLLDGSNQVDPAALLEQKNFVDVLLAITTPDISMTASFCSYIYATQSHPMVSPLSNDRKSFLRVLNVTQPPLERGIANAGLVLRDGLDTVRYSHFKGPGHGNIILFAKRKPVFRAPGYYRRMTCFKNDGGNIWGIAMSGRARVKLEHVADRIFTTADFFDVAEVIVGRLVQTCNESKLDVV